MPPSRSCKTSGTIRGSVGVRRKNDIPEQRRGRQELHGNERPVLIHLRRAYNVHLAFLLWFLFFYYLIRALRNSLPNKDHPAASGSCVSKTLSWRWIISQG